MSERFDLGGGRTLILESADITTRRADAVVNAANEAMLGGGGVDGAIHCAAGPRLLDACREVPEVRPGVRCPTGEARITPGFDLPARFVIHTVGPVYRSAAASASLLTSSYRASLDIATNRGLDTIAFPAISCGVYGYPLDEAAAIAIETCRDHTGGPTEIRCALFGDDVYRAWRAAASSRLTRT